MQYLDFTCDEIIDYFFNDYSKEEIASMQDYNFYDLEEIYNKIIFNAKKEANATQQEKVKLLSQNRLFKLIYT